MVPRENVWTWIYADKRAQKYSKNDKQSGGDKRSH